jgi:hypothetical protein
MAKAEKNLEYFVVPESEQASKSYGDLCVTNSHRNQLMEFPTHQIWDNLNMTINNDTTYDNLLNKLEICVSCQ